MASRRHKECNGWKNWDTWQANVIVNNDYKTYNYVRRNKKRLLSMKRKTNARLFHAG